MRPGPVERCTHDHRRHGTTTLFAALNMKTSELITQFHQRHRSSEFRQFLDAVEAAVPPHQAAARPRHSLREPRGQDTGAAPLKLLLLDRYGCGSISAA